MFNPYRNNENIPSPNHKSKGERGGNFDFSFQICTRKISSPNLTREVKGMGNGKGIYTPDCNQTELNLQSEL